MIEIKKLPISTRLEKILKFINICCVHFVGKPLEIVSLVNVLYSSKSPERKKRIKFRVYKRLFIKYGNF